MAICVIRFGNNDKSEASFKCQRSVMNCNKCTDPITIVSKYKGFILHRPLQKKMTKYGQSTLFLML